MTIIRNTEGCVFGGYATVPWTSLRLSLRTRVLGGYNKDAFLFTIKNPENQITKICGFFLTNDPDSGPIYSKNKCNYLIVANQSNTNRDSKVYFDEYKCDKKGFVNDSFKTLEIEVFLVETVSCECKKCMCVTNNCPCKKDDQNCTEICHEKNKGQCNNRFNFINYFNFLFDLFFKFFFKGKTRPNCFSPHPLRSKYLKPNQFNLLQVVQALLLKDSDGPLGSTNKNNN